MTQAISTRLLTTVHMLSSWFTKHKTLVLVCTGKNDMLSVLLAIEPKWPTWELDLHQFQFLTGHKGIREKKEDKLVVCCELCKSRSDSGHSGQSFWKKNVENVSISSSFSCFGIRTHLFKRLLQWKGREMKSSLVKDQLCVVSSSHKVEHISFGKGFPHPFIERKSRPPKAHLGERTLEHHRVENTSVHWVLANCHTCADKLYSCHVKLQNAAKLYTII